MPKKQGIQDLSEEDLRWLLVEKRRSARHERVERFRRSGRAILLASNTPDTALDTWQTGLTAGPDEADEMGGMAPRPARRKRFLDVFLLIIEVGAVAGFIFILFNVLNVFQALNKEYVLAQIQPTLTPTPIISAVVLPSGHTPPNSPGGTRFNEAEIPEHLRPLVQSLANVALPPASPEQAVRIQIPSIHVDAPVVQGDGWEQLKKGVGQHAATGNPGQAGNMVFSAHNDIFGEIFRDLDRLKPGDLVIIYTNQRSYTYVVVESKIVEPTQVEVMNSTGQPSLTLISCYPYLVDKQRIVIIARLQGGGA